LQPCCWIVGSWSLKNVLPPKWYARRSRRTKRREEEAERRREEEEGALSKTRSLIGSILEAGTEKRERRRQKELREGGGEGGTPFSHSSRLLTG
jgi:hypothetical protein